MKIKTIDLQAADSGKNFADSMHKNGFAILENHNIPLELLTKVYKKWDKFFNSEAKNKHLLYFPSDHYPAEITKLTEELFYSLINLAKELLFWLEINCPSSVAIGFKEPLSRVVSVEKSFFRISNRQPLKDSPIQHEDISLITLLPDVGTDFGQIVVNVGDMLQECSQNYYQSTTHQVINLEYTDNQPCMSMPLFLRPRGDFYLSERYNKAQNYLEERLEELGLV